MPIYYAALINQRNMVVLQGADKNSRTLFKSDIERHTDQIRDYGFSRVEFSTNYFITFRNLERQVTCALVISKEVDKQEEMAFFNEFFDVFVQQEIL